MSFTWAIDQTIWDLSIKNGKLKTVSGIDEIQQRILVTLWHYWEEYFLNVPAGMPWYELILGSKDQQMVEALIRRAILSVPGVISIVRFRIQAPLALMRDFAIFVDVEVLGGVVSLLTTPPKTTITQYLTTENDIPITTENDVYLET